jgi:hypothetical protein
VDATEAPAPAPAPAAPAPPPAAAAPAPAAEAPPKVPEQPEAPAKAEGSPPREKPAEKAEKDVAREAWRKNLPDVSTDGAKAAMIIPIKGSIDGATYHVTTKPRAVLVTLPKGESMITMPFYSIKHDGFRQLWIKKDEGSGASVLRVVLLAEAGEPQVEIKDEFVRVTVRRPAGTPQAEPAKAPSEESQETKAQGN